MLDSRYRRLVPVTLPEFRFRQKYMHSFDLAKPEMAPGFEDYLEPVTALVRAAGAHHGFAHMTVDEKIVQAGMSQRRPHPHVDGCYIPSLGDWGHDGGGGGSSWRHYCNNISTNRIGRMAVIVASSVAGCCAWEGAFSGEPKSDGDLTHIADQLKDGKVLEPSIGYLLSPDCVHESMVFEKPVSRTFLRIALPLTFSF